MSKKTLILTGCAGFIGFNFIKELFSDNSYLEYFNKIISIDVLSYATKYNAKEYVELCKAKNVILFNCDINKLQKSSLPIADYEEIVILDLASSSHVDVSIKSPERTFLENSTIPLNLLGAIRSSNIHCYYHISTDEVYGDLDYDTTPDKWFKTDSQFKPSNPYSASKVAQDAYLMSLRHTYGLNVKFIRMANQFGPHQYPEKMIPFSVMNVINNKPIKIYGEGKNKRQWTYVKTTAKILKDCIFEKLNFEDTLHVADERNLFENNYIVKRLADVLNMRNYYVETKKVEDRLGHDRCYALTVDNKEVKKYFENDNFYDNLKETVDFYINNKDTFGA
jgi:dTDP-glucose 4,6-dehydratase